MTATETFGRPPELKWLPLDILQVDSRYQREITRQGWKLIRRIVRDFRWSRFQALIVAGPDKLGDFSVVDGQHRLEAARQVGGIEKVPCLVIDAADLPRQARTFKAINRERQAVTRVTTFWADVAAGDETAIRIAAICRDCGVTISRVGTGRQKPLHTVAVSAIERLMKVHEVALRQALKVLVEAQGEAENAFRSATIRALAFMFGLKPDLDRARLVRVLADMDLDDKIADARSYRKTVGGSVDAGLQVILTRAYNKGLADANRIPEPRG